VETRQDGGEKKSRSRNRLAKRGLLNRRPVKTVAVESELQGPGTNMQYEPREMRLGRDGAKRKPCVRKSWRKMFPRGNGWGSEKRG